MLLKKNYKYGAAILEDDGIIDHDEYDDPDNHARHDEIDE